MRCHAEFGWLGEPGQPNSRRAQDLDVRLSEDLENCGTAGCGSVWLFLGGCAVVEGGADVGFEAVQLFQQRGALDAQLCGCVCDGRVGHGDGEAFQPGPAASLSADCA